MSYWMQSIMSGYCGLINPSLNNLGRNIYSQNLIMIIFEG
jgi:hypothetical protein